MTRHQYLSQFHRATQSRTMKQFVFLAALIALAVAAVDKEDQKLAASSVSADQETQANGYSPRATGFGRGGYAGRSYGGFGSYDSPAMYGSRYGRGFGRSLGGYGDFGFGNGGYGSRGSYGAYNRPSYGGYGQLYGGLGGYGRRYGGYSGYGSRAGAYGGYGRRYGGLGGNGRVSGAYNGGYGGYY